MSGTKGLREEVFGSPDISRMTEPLQPHFEAEHERSL